MASPWIGQRQVLIVPSRQLQATLKIPWLIREKVGKQIGLVYKRDQLLTCFQDDLPLSFLFVVKEDDAEGLAELVFENLRNEPHVFLLPEYEDPTAQKEVLEQSWPDLFEAMLEGWVTDEAFWPKDRTLGMFQEWFEIQMCSIVQDLDMDEPL